MLFALIRRLVWPRSPPPAREGAPPAVAVDAVGPGFLSRRVTNMVVVHSSQPFVTGNYAVAVYLGTAHIERDLSKWQWPETAVASIVVARSPGGQGAYPWPQT